jgi:hypothetical protein
MRIGDGVRGLTTRPFSRIAILASVVTGLPADGLSDGLSELSRRRF